MQVTYELVNSILKTLPISYYLKRKLNVQLVKDIPNSYIDLMNDSIYISFNQIKKMKDINNINIESHIRTILYHEVSHAMLSPIPKSYIISKEDYNVFEDERIETLSNNLYLDVDFKKTLFALTPNRIALTEHDEFFDIVRLRLGTYEQNVMIDNIIKKHSHLKYQPYEQNVSEYQHDISLLHKSIFKPNELSVADKENIDKLSNPTFCKEFNDSKDGNDIHIDLNSIFDYYSNKEFRKELIAIFESIKLSKGMNSSSKLAYSGRIRPKQINKPNDTYKWWVKQGDGFIKNNKKLCLNLFIDQSGSFKPFEQKANSIIKELIRLEKIYPFFKLNLITLDNDINYVSKRQIYCSGGNSLTSKIKYEIKKFYNSQNQNINILLFNGDLIDMDTTDPITNEYLPKYSDLQAKNLIHFNLPNTFIISDYANKKYLDEYCNDIKVIYTNNYLEEFEANILKGIKILLTFSYWHTYILLL